MTDSAPRARHPRPARLGLRTARVAARTAAAGLAAAIAAGALVVTSTTGPATAGPAAAESGPAVAALGAESDAAWDVSTVDGPYGAGRPNYDYSIEPGDRIDDRLLVTNTGDARIDVRLYAADAFTTDAGQLDLRTSGHEPIGVGAWLSLPATEVALEAGESAEVPFAITVPEDARGEYIGGIVTTVPEASADPGVEHRAAVRVRLHVGGTFHPRMSVEDVRVDYAPALLGPGRATVTYTVRNTGDTVLSAEQSVALSGPFGLSPRTANDVGNTPELLPGESWSMSVPVDDVAQVGTLSVAVTAVPLYTDPAGSTGPLDAVGSSGLGWAIPWIPLLVALALAAGAVVLVLRWRRASRSASPEDQPAASE
ncbi:WxL protein peptidoglycan domain-containing protein [Agromyces sp. NPDC004153]